jgi:hypothetical protein
VFVGWCGCTASQTTAENTAMNHSTIPCCSRLYSKICAESESVVPLQLLDTNAVGVKREKMYRIDQHMACAVAGLTGASSPDAQSQCQCVSDTVTTADCHPAIPVGICTNVSVTRLIPQQVSVVVRALIRDVCGVL